MYDIEDVRVAVYETFTLSCDCELASGSQGTVYRARSEDGEWFAVKVFKHVDPSFNVETSVLSRIDHPNVISMKAHGVVRMHGLYRGVIVMEMGRQTLFDILTQGALGEHGARVYSHQLLEGLKECHRLKIAHCDIKLENTISGQDGAMRIADFGLSQVTSQCNHWKGSQAYVCPEMNHGEFPCDARKADVWSAGVVVFTMLVGQFPFNKAHRSDACFRSLLKHGFDQFLREHRSPALSDDAKSFLAQALCVDPQMRGSVIELLQHPWFRTTPDTVTGH
jgi:serine/threonine protein kinase